MIAAGLDLGTRAAKVVIVKDGELIAWESSPVNDVLGRLGKRLLKSAMKSARVSRWKLDRIAVTDYGMKAIRFADKQFPAPVCLARAAHRLAPGVRTVIDIGGLVSRVVKVADDGSVEDYLENERCASGSGRFLEMIAEALETPLEEIGPLALSSTRPLRLTSQCVVFAESEVVSLVNQGHEPADILAGLHRSIAERVSSMANRLPAAAPLAVTGGVAKNPAVIKCLEDEMRLPVRPLSQDPQIACALGAALAAMER